jgi:TonB family protein
MTKDQKTLLLYPAGKTGDSYTIPAATTDVAEYAFNNSQLKHVTIPATTTAIPLSVFNGCNSLSSISVAEGNLKYKATDDVLMTKDGKTLLRYPAGKTDDAYTVPSTIELIEWGAFSSCGLKSIVINNENISISAYAFRDCKKLINVQIPFKTVKGLPETAFSGCISLTNISLEDGSQSISAEPYKNDTSNQVLDSADQMPSFPGGEKALFTWMSRHIKYPIKAQENDIQGRVVCTFIVETDGSIYDVQVTKPVDPSLDQEAIRVIKSMPKWNPGIKDGQPVRVKNSIPVTFRLSSGDEKSLNKNTLNNHDLNR